MWGRRMTSPPRIGGLYNRARAASRGGVVGAIDIQNNFSIVEISAELARMCWPRSTGCIHKRGSKVSGRRDRRTARIHASPLRLASAASAAPRSAKNHDGSHLWQKKPTANRGKKGFLLPGAIPLARQVHPTLFLGVGPPRPS